MARRKREHFAQMKSWDHVLEPMPGESSNLKGSWGGHVILELGCGKGIYTLALAERFPEVTVVGVDLKGARLWHGAQAALEGGVANARFLRIRVEDLVEHFDTGEVDEIWVTFPDPHPREGKAKKRLMAGRFLQLYRQVLKPGGLLHLKTDSRILFDSALESLAEDGWEVLERNEDVHGWEAPGILTEIRTPYEERFMKEGKKILYLRARPL